MSQNDVDASKQPVNYQVLIPQEYYGGRQDDEISLIDLFLILWRKRFWIVGLTGLITLVSIFYALSLKPVYQTNAYLVAPKANDIDVLNLLAVQEEGKSEKSHTTATVYKHALDNFKSRKYRWLFFDQNNLIKLYLKKPDADIRPRDVFNDGFYSSVKVEDKDEQKISFSYGDKQEVVRLLNQYIAFINDETVKALLEEVNGAVQFEKQQIEQQIEQLRQNALLQRKDRIQQIKEQLTIAHKLGMHASKLTGAFSVTSDGRNLLPHYSEGRKSLQIKLDAYSSRKSDDPYIKELRPLQIRLSVLEKAKIDTSQLRTFNVDQAAQEPKYPIKPNKRLIVILGFILGGMLSVFAVFVWRYIEKYREGQGL